MKISGERVMSGLVGVAAVAVAAVALHREFGAPAGREYVPQRQSSYMEGWREIVESGRIIGDTLARVKLIEFADLECPFCSRFNLIVQRVAARYPRDVAFVFVHRPLAMHRFALPAARAAECANRFGKFAEFVDVSYRKQDSLGLKSWMSLGWDAGIRDTAQFGRCVGGSEKMPRVDAGAAAADKLSVNATPTVILNGWRYAVPPSDTELFRAIDDILAGRKPYPEFGVSGR